MATELWDPDGGLLLADAQRMAPGRGHDPTSIGILDAHDVVATLYVVSGRMKPTALVDLLRQTLAARSEVLAGVSELPGGCGAVVRLLGPTSGTVNGALRTAWAAARLALLGVPVPDLRKG